MTFDELFKNHNLTPGERESLVAYLAAVRAQKTVKALATPESPDVLWLKAHLHELRALLDRRPAVNAGLVESYQRWTAEVYALDWLNALDAPPTSGQAQSRPVCADCNGTGSSSFNAGSCMVCNGTGHT